MDLFSERSLTQQARAAGYEVLAIEQLRPSRWLMTIRDERGQPAVVMVQRRPLIGAADVQDLSEIVQVRRVARGILLAPGAAFSVAAQQTQAELGRDRLRLCTALAPAAAAEPVAEPKKLALPLNQIS